VYITCKITWFWVSRYVRPYCDGKKRRSSTHARAGTYIPCVFHKIVFFYFIF